MNNPHKDVIAAWANGAAVQVQDSEGNWDDVDRPLWGRASKYRVKPTNDQSLLRPNEENTNPRP